MSALPLCGRSADDTISAQLQQSLGGKVQQFAQHLVGVLANQWRPRQLATAVDGFVRS